MTLAVYGTGGTGKEVTEMAAMLGTYDDIIYIDDTKPECTVDARYCCPFDTFTKKYSPIQVEISIAVGTPYIREALFDRISRSGYTPATLIHPQTSIASSARISRGCTIQCFSFISSRVVLEENTFIQPQVYIAHDTVIGKNSIISAGAKIAGNCRILRNTYIGLQASVREMTTVGENTIIGMHSCVTADIADNVVAYGVPAFVRGPNNNRKIFK